MAPAARTVFLGSGEFAVPAATALMAQPATELVGVVTAPARPAGRRGQLTPTPMQRWASEHGLTTLTPDRLREPAAMTALAGLQPDLLVLADYGQLVPAALLELPRHGALNLHPSLLPRHRGAAPVPAAILAGDRETGVSLMLMDAGLDSGPIVAQRRVVLHGDETTPELERRLSLLAADLLAEAIVAWLRGEIEPRAQPAEGTTMTRPLRRTDGRLDARRPAVELERQVRAFQPWPGSFLEIDGERLIVWRAGVTAGRAGAPPGALVKVGSNPALVAADGVLELIEVQPAGGRRMAGSDWLRGHPGTLQASVAAER